MSQDIVNENQKLSYTNLDFSSIYTEVLDMTKQLTKDWDPSISDESDPGVILVKLSALLADKCNYNIDKSILEAFPLSVTQDSNARQLYEQLGYYMHWYQAASVPVSLKWKQTSLDEEFYTIPKFSTVTNDNDSVVYTLVGTRGESDVVVSDGILYLDENKTLEMIAYEGIPTTYTFNDSTIITPNMVDSNNRLYLSTSLVFENGIFIKNKNQDNYSEWHRVDNLYEYSYNVHRYKFGYDSASNLCYLEFPDNYAELFGEGIEITYLTFSTDEPFDNVSPNYLCKFFTPINVGENNQIGLTKEVIEISNTSMSMGHKEKEGLNEAYKNYKKTVGTFNTLITLRDYLNYVRSSDLNLCSNAIVTDRTNDVQSTYKIVSKQNGIESLITQIEQSSEVNKFIKTKDEDVLFNKTYFTKQPNGAFDVVSNPTPENISSYYECVGEEVLSPFSLKFYLLRNSLAITSGTEFNNSFKLTSDNIDMDSVLEGSSHLVHTFNEIEPLPEHIEDALLSRIIMIKNKYPISMNISTYNSISYDDRLDIYRNIMKAFFKNLDSSNVEFGENISLEYITHIATTADTRIKQVTFNTTESKSYAVYYNSETKQYEEILLPGSLNDLNNLLNLDKRTYDEILSLTIGKEIVCKSILKGTTQLLIPDDSFKYHLNQKFLEYRDSVMYLSGEAIIDMNNTDSSETYKIIEGNESKTTNSYTLKENEVITLFRPVLKDDQEFTSGVHYDYNIFSSIKSGQSYQLKLGERFVFFTSNLDSSGKLESFTVYVFNEGSIISPTFDIPARDRANIPEVIRSIDSTTKKDSSNYMYTESSVVQVNKINSNAGVSNTKIDVNNSIRVQSVSRFTILPEDGYRFIWVLNKSNYNNDLKSYTLFDEYDSSDDILLENSDKINKYTLKNNEILCYTDSSMSTLGYVGAGTTIYRNCGTTSSNYTDIVSGDGQFVFVKWSDLKEGEHKALGSGIGDYGPKLGGLYELSGNQFIRSNDNDYVDGKDYYILIMKDTSGWFLSKTTSDNSVIYYPAATPTTSVFKEVDLIEDYKDVDGNISMINPAEEGLYEVVSVNNEEVVDAYRLASKKCDTFTNLYTDNEDNRKAFVGKYKRFTNTLDDSAITSTFIKTDDDRILNTEDTSTFGNVTISVDGEYSPSKLKLVTKSDNNKLIMAKTTDRLFKSITLDYNEHDMSRYFYKNTYNSSTYKYANTLTSGKLELSSNNIITIHDIYTNADKIFESNIEFFNKIDKDTKNSLLIDDDLSNFKLNIFNNVGEDKEILTWSNTLTEQQIKDKFFELPLSSIESIPTEAINIVKENIHLGFMKNPQDVSKIIISCFIPLSKEILNYPILSGQFYTYTVGEYFPLSYTTHYQDFTIQGESDIRSAYSDASDVLFSRNASGTLSLTGLKATSYNREYDLITSTDLCCTYLSNLTYFNTCVDKLNTLLGNSYTTGTYYMPHWYELDRWYKYVDKKYYVPMQYSHRNVAKIPPLVCYDAGGVDIMKAPIETLTNLFSSVQTNTSLTFTQNEMTVLSNGDIITVSTNDAYDKDRILPVFSNNPITLDLDAYDISYQRSGESFVDVDKITIDNCSWQAYSNLKINSTGTNGQKLYSNHTLTAYTLEESGEIIQLGEKIQCGAGNNNVHFQLKNDILTGMGTYIDVSNIDDLTSNSIALNKLYVYNVASDADRYSYDNDYNTYLHFKKITENEGVTYICLGDRDATSLPDIVKSDVGDIALPTGNYLIPINGLSDTKITLTYHYTGIGTSYQNGIPGEQTKFTNSVNISVYNVPDQITKNYFLGDKLHFGLLQIPSEIELESVTVKDCKITNGYIIVSIDKAFTGESLSIVINDLFKFEENDLLGLAFKDIKAKLMNLDINSNFNYTHRVDEDDLIVDPLLANSYWDKGHPYNAFTIPQLDIDNIKYTFNKTIT